MIYSNTRKSLKNNNKVNVSERRQWDETFEYDRLQAG